MPTNGVRLMNENASVVPVDGNVTPDFVTVVSAGQLLKTAREAQGLHIAALAVSLKVPVKKLEALEAERFDLLTDTVFVRALASSVCRTLKIDAAPVLALLPQTTAPRLKTDESGINTTFRVTDGGFGATFFEQLSKPMVLVVFALLSGALLITVFPFAERAVVAITPKAAPVSEAVSSPTLIAPALEKTSIVESVNSNQVAVVVQSSANEIAVMSSSMDVASPMKSPTDANVAVISGSGAMTGIVVLKARGSSWVEVTDANGVVQVRKTLKDGEIVGASGVVPLAVVVGRADTTEVQVHGRPFDLTSIAKDNVARFEVK